MMVSLASQIGSAAGRRVRSLPTVRLRGMHLHAVTPAEANAYILSELSAGRGGWVITPNLDHLRRVRYDAEFAAFFGKANLVLADGMPLVWASRIQGTPLPDRVPGSGLIWSLSHAAAQKSIPIYLLGGTPGTAEAAARQLQTANPGLVIAGVDCPPIGFERDDAAIEAIARRLEIAGPGIIFVALGSPKQEVLINRLRDRLPQAWWLGVGISFSFVCGQVKRAPVWMQNLGMEWIHRLIQEPRRLGKRYLIDGLPFAFVLFVGAFWRRLRPTT